MRLLLLTFALTGVAGHGSMNNPIPRNNRGNQTLKPPKGRVGLGPGGPGCAGYACGWYSLGCQIGCVCAGYQVGIDGAYATPDQYECSHPAEPTLAADSPFRTWNMAVKSPKGDMAVRSPKGDWTKYNPWRAPGYATPLNPCGVASGGKGPKEQDGSGPLPKGYHYGVNGTDIPPLPPTIWKAGGTVEVSHGLTVNHGGGYQYRLCPKTKAPTEACFQSMPLAFATGTHTIHYEDGSRKDFTVPATDVSEGTMPAGSAWRRGPVPACNCDENEPKGRRGVECGGRLWGDDPAERFIYPDSPPGSPTRCSTGLQFAPLWDGAFGYEEFSFSIRDQVRVPAQPGDYILSWRWDCEQTAQIWSSCADIKITV